MSFDQNITVDGKEYDAWKVSLTMPSTPTIYYYKFLINQGGATAFYSDDYLDDYDNLNKDGTGVVSSSEPFDSFQITVFDPQLPNSRMDGDRERLSNFSGPFPEWRFDQRLLRSEQHRGLPVVLRPAALKYPCRDYLEHVAVRSIQSGQRLHR